MTIVLHLPCGKTAKLTDLNLHDLRQYYMYQMDLLEQAKDMLNSLRLVGWVTGIDSENTANQLHVPLRESAPVAFLTTPDEGNTLPTYYAEGDWQGMAHTNGVRSFPQVGKMTVEQLHAEIINQDGALQHFQNATVALSNFASNVSRGVQDPRV